MTTARKSYSPETRLAVAIYAERNSDKLASEHFGIPRRSVTDIRARLEGTPEMAQARTIIVDTLAGEYLRAERLLLARARAVAEDPNTTPTMIAKMLSVIAPMARLTSGEATSRTQASTLTMKLDAYRMPARERPRAISPGDLPDKT